MSDPVKIVHVDGGEYEFLGVARGAGQSKGMEDVRVYKGEDGRLWFRHDPYDFYDRFKVKAK